MKILSWNINGIRAVFKKGFLDFLKIKKPDILCLQEIKIAKSMIIKEGFQEDHRNAAGESLENYLFPNYQVFWNSAERPGYSGTAILIRNEVLETGDFRVINGMGVEKFDIEGRTQILEADNFYLVNNYYPNANGELSRLPYKLDFNRALLKKIKKLEKIKPVIIAGDMNVAHEEIDLARPKPNIGKAGFTNEERESMTEFLKAGFVDTFRYFYPEKVKYSWWSYRGAARKRNVGWRIDYFCVSKKIIKKIKKAEILNEIMGSDHCPIKILIE